MNIKEYINYDRHNRIQDYVMKEYDKYMSDISQHNNNVVDHLMEALLCTRYNAFSLSDMKDNYKEIHAFIYDLVQHLFIYNKIQFKNTDILIVNMEIFNFLLSIAGVCLTIYKDDYKKSNTQINTKIMFWIHQLIHPKKALNYVYISPDYIFIHKVKDRVITCTTYYETHHISKLHYMDVVPVNVDVLESFNSFATTNLKSNLKYLRLDGIQQ